MIVNLKLGLNYQTSPGLKNKIKIKNFLSYNHRTIWKLQDFVLSIFSWYNLSYLFNTAWRLNERSIFFILWEFHIKKYSSCFILWKSASEIVTRLFFFLLVYCRTDWILFSNFFNQPILRYWFNFMIRKSGEIFQAFDFNGFWVISV